MSHIKNKEYTFVDLLADKGNFIIPSYQRALQLDDSIFMSILETVSDIDAVSSIYKNTLKYDNPVKHELQNDKDFKREQIFMGNIVIQDKNLVDGQQRITSLMIIMKAILDSAKGTKGYQEKSFPILSTLGKFLRPEIYGVKNSMIISKVAKQEGRHKSFLEGKLNKRFKITNLYNKAMKNLIINSDESVDNYLERLEKFTFKIYSIQFIVLEIFNIEEAFDIFEKLNSKSTPLRPADLVKNKIMALLHGHKTKDANNIFADILSNLHDFDESSFYRMVMVIYKSDKLDKNSNKSKDKDVYVKKSSLFQDEFENIGLSEAIEKIDMILKYSKIYEDYFYSKNVNVTIKNLAGRFFDTKRVKVISTLSLYLINLHNEKYIDLPEFRKLIIMLENYFLGMFTLNNNPANEVDKIIPRIVRDIALLAKQNFESIEKILVGRLLPEYPEQDRKMVYKKLVDNSFKNKAASHLLNKLFDEYDGITKTPKEHSYKAVNIIINEYTKSIEHLLPQKPNKWFEEGYFGIDKPLNLSNIETDDDVYKYIHSIGNMFLLSRSKNSGLSNLIMKDKIKKLNDDENNANSKNMILDTLYIKDDIFGDKIWNGSRINARSKEISDIFKKFDLLSFGPKVNYSK